MLSTGKKPQQTATRVRRKRRLAHAVTLIVFSVIATAVPLGGSAANAAEDPKNSTEATTPGLYQSNNLPANVLQGYARHKTFTYDFVSYSDSITTSRFEDSTTSRQRIETKATLALTGLWFAANGDEWVNFQVLDGSIESGTLPDVTKVADGTSFWRRLPAANRNAPLTFGELPSVQFRQDASGRIVEIRRPDGLTTSQLHLIEGLLGEFSFELRDSASYQTTESDRYGDLTVDYTRSGVLNVGSNFRTGSPGRIANRLFPSNNASAWQFEGQNGTRWRSVAKGLPAGHGRARHVFLGEDGLVLGISRNEARNTAERLPQTGLPGKPVIMSDAPMVDVKLRADTAIGLRSISNTPSSEIASYQTGASTGTFARLDKNTRIDQAEALRRNVQAKAMEHALALMVTDPEHPDLTKNLVRALRAHPAKATEVAAVVYAKQDDRHVDAAIRAMIVGSDWTMQSQHELAKLVTSNAIDDDEKLKIAVSSMTMSQPQPVFINALMNEALEPTTHPMVLRATGAVLENADTATRNAAISRLESHKPSATGDRRAALDDAIANASSGNNNDDSNSKKSDSNSQRRIPDTTWTAGDEYLTADGNFGFSWDAEIEILTENRDTVSYSAEAGADLILFGEPQELVEARFVSDSLNRVNEINDDNKDAWYYALDLPGEGGQGGVIYREANIYVSALNNVLIDRDFQFPCGYGASGDFLVKENGDRLVEIDKYFYQTIPIFGPFAQAYLEGEIAGAVLLPYEFGIEVCNPLDDTYYFDPSVNLSPGSASDSAASVEASHIASISATLTPTVEATGRVEAGVSILFVIGGGVGLRGPIVEASAPSNASVAAMWVSEAQAAPAAWTDKGLKLQLCYDIDAAVDLFDPVELYGTFGYVGPDLAELTGGESGWLGGISDYLEDALSWTGVISSDIISDLAGGETDWQNHRWDLINSACPPVEPLVPIIIDNTTPDAPTTPPAVLSNPTRNGSQVAVNEASADQLCIEAGYPAGADSWMGSGATFPSPPVQTYENGSWVAGDPGFFLSSVTCITQVAGTGGVAVSAPSFEQSDQTLAGASPTVQPDEAVFISFDITNNSDVAVYFPLGSESWTSSFQFGPAAGGCSPTSDFGASDLTLSSNADGELAVALAPGATMVCGQFFPIPAGTGPQTITVNFALAGIDEDGNPVNETNQATFQVGTGSTSAAANHVIQGSINNQSVANNSTVNDLTVGDTVGFAFEVRDLSGSAHTWTAGIGQRQGVSNVSTLQCNPATSNALIGYQTARCTGTFVVTADGYLTFTATVGGLTQTFRVNLNADPVVTPGGPEIEITALSINGVAGSLTGLNEISHGINNDVGFTIANPGQGALTLDFPNDFTITGSSATYRHVDTIECDGSRTARSITIPAGGSIDCIVAVWLYDSASDDLLSITVEPGNLAAGAAIELTSDDRPTALIIMGDSFASGEGGRWRGNSSVDGGNSQGTDRAAYQTDALTWQFDTTAIYANTDVDGGNVCHRSDVGDLVWDPSLVDGRTNLACSGAVTADVRNDVPLTAYNQGQDGTSQVTRLIDEQRTSDIEMIVLSIGGNDLGFRSIILNCVGRFSTGTGECRGAQEQALNSRMGEAMANLDATIKNIQATLVENGDRHVRIVLQGNPSPLPRTLRYTTRGSRIGTGGCPFYDGDAAWARDTVTQIIGDGMRTVADNNDIEFLDLSDLLEGREVCSPNAAQGTAVATAEWVRMVTIGAHGVGDSQESMHPNALGQEAIAHCINEHLRQVPGNYSCFNRGQLGPDQIRLVRDF